MSPASGESAWWNPGAEAHRSRDQADAMQAQKRLEKTMREIDEIRIDGDEDGWHLTIHTDDGIEHYRIGMPDQFDNEVRRTIRRWLAEGEAARASMPSNVARDVNPLWDSGYAPDDQKSPGYHDRMVD